MFRKLMQLEAAALRDDDARNGVDTDEGSLMRFAGQLVPTQFGPGQFAQCLPSLPPRFGVCAARFDG